MTDAELEELVAKLLANFYERRLGKLSEITLTTICRKNPYLFRAIGMVKPADIIEGVLQAFLSSSEETVFGNIFFEPLALAASHAKGGRPSGATGVDIEYTSETTNTAIAVKSATNSQNASAQTKQNTEFMELRSRLLKTRKNFDAIIGYCYGRATGTPSNRIFRRMAGQEFWEELTGDEQFYIKIIHAMGTLPDVHKKLYDAERIRLGVRLETDFAVNFVAVTGDIDWDKLVAFNSGKKPPFRLQRAVTKPGTNQVVLEEIPVYETDAGSVSDTEGKQSQETILGDDLEEA